jgi:hypothetical protein
MEDIPADLWDAWMAYYSIAPWGEERGDLQAGIVASTVANCMGRGKGQPAFNPEDFMPKFSKSEAEPMSEERKAISDMMREQLKEI